MTINDFVFQNTTKVYFGKDQLENLPNEIKKYGTKIMLTYGGGFIKRIGLFVLPVAFNNSKFCILRAPI